MFKSILQIVLFCLVSFSAFAQPVRDIPYRMKVEAAETAFANKNYYAAAEWFGKAYKESRDKDLAIKVAETYYLLRDYKKATNWYKRVIDRDKAGLYSEHKLNYGLALKTNGDYTKAYEILNSYMSEATSDSLRALAMLQIMGIEESANFKDNPDASIRPVSKKINSKASESGAVPVGSDEMYFSSLKRKEIYVKGESDKGEKYFKIYKTKREEDGYKKATALGEEINRDEYHSSSPSVTEDGSTMYFIRTFMEDGLVLESKLYYSNKNGDSWGAASEVEGINGDYQVKHPAVGELFGKKVLFFVSDMPGGFGGSDIYYADQLGEGRFGDAKNLGPSINSQYDEITPFYRDGSLYYSSDGRPGLGGFDIYKTDWDGSKWSKVENLGNGYNTTFDDFFYSMNKEGNEGFLVSNRPAEGKRSLLSKTCCDDIFVINIKEVVIDLMAKVTNEKEEALNGAKITLYDLTVGEGKVGPDSKTNLKSNLFSFGLDEDKKYKVVIEKEGYYKDSLEFNTVGILDDYTVNRTIKLKEIPEPKEEVEIITVNKPIRMSNIYYDLNDDKILPAAEQDLNLILELMVKYPEMVIELSSHTDAQGTSSYNKKLSQRRANSAKKWLVERGVSDERINAVGYGEEMILNRCVNGVRCSDEEHRYNRRTEFKIVSGPTTIEIKKRKVISPSNGFPMGSANVPNTTIEFVQNDLQLGKVKIGDLIDFKFEFKNTGKNDLIIRTVTACHCTTYEYPQNPVKPGEMGVITVTYDGSKKKNGPAEYREAINIICNTENVVEEAIFHIEVVKE